VLLPASQLVRAAIDTCDLSPNLVLCAYAACYVGEMPPAEPGDKAQGKGPANEPIAKQTRRVEPSQGRCAQANQPPRLLEGFLCGNFTPGDQELFNCSL